MEGNREYRSDVFSMLLQENDMALDVYNALNHTHYTDPELVTIITMDKGISLSVRNDASFIIDMSMNFYEHQSTVNPNMPLRQMIYYANTMENWIKINENNLYSRHLIKIPRPKFVVFYNGREKREEQYEMRLSEAFEGDGNSDLELVTHVYNINPGYNEELKNISKVISGYSCFVEKVLEYSQSKDKKEAIDKAIDYCIKHDILAEFFSRERDEVTKVTNIDMTFETRLRLEKKEEREIGRQQGMQQGMQQGLANLVSTLKEFTDDFDIIYEKVIKNEDYKDYTKEEVRKYF